MSSLLKKSPPSASSPKSDVWVGGSDMYGGGGIAPFFGGEGGGVISKNYSGFTKSAPPNEGVGEK